MHLLQCTVVAFVPDKLILSTIPEMTRITRCRSVAFCKKKEHVHFYTVLVRMHLFYNNGHLFFCVNEKMEISISSKK